MDWPHRRPCDCEARPVLVTAVITDAGGNVRAVRGAEYFVRPHRYHDDRETED